MLAIVDRLLDRAYRMAQARIAWVNVGLAAFVALAHGGALMVARSQASPDLGVIGSLAKISLPLSAVVIVSAIAAVAHRQLLPRVLSLHAVVLALSAIWLLADAVDMLLFGIPDGNFVWSVGLFSAWITYATVLVLRFLVARTPEALDRLYYVPAYALLAAMSIDIGVLLRSLSRVAAI